MEINLNPGFFLPASEYFRRHKDVQKRHSGSLSPLLEALNLLTESTITFSKSGYFILYMIVLIFLLDFYWSKIFINIY